MQKKFHFPHNIKSQFLCEYFKECHFQVEMSILFLIRKFNSKLNFYKLIPYLVEKEKKNVLSWALAGTGRVLFIRQVAV